MTKKKTRARREEDKGRRRDAILDAAEKVIAKVGVKGMNFGAVAKLSRLSRSLIYVYFPSRYHLVRAVCERGVADLRERFLAVAAAHRTGLDQVMAMGRAYQVFSREQPLYFSVIAEIEAEACAQASAGLADSGAELGDSGKQDIGLVAEAVRRGQEDGSISRATGNPLHTAVTIWAFTHGLIQVSNAKQTMLREELGLDAEAVIDHGFLLLRQTLAGNRRT